MTTLLHMTEQRPLPSSQVHRFPGTLSKEEQQHFLTYLAYPEHASASQIKHARACLFEEYQSLAHSLARRCCPQSNLSLLPDLIQEATIGLFQALTPHPTFSTLDSSRLGGYLTACIRHRLQRALGRDYLIRIPGRAYAAMSQEAVMDLRPLSLDLAWEDMSGEEHCLLDHLASSPLEAAPSSHQEPTSVQQAQLEALFTWLSPRAQQALRLRYGLTEDGRALPLEDIAQVMQTSRRAVVNLLGRTHCRLRQLASGEIVARTPRVRKQPASKSEPPRNRYHQDLVQQAYASLQHEGGVITVRTLAQRANVHRATAQKFLRREQETVLFPGGSCQQRLQAASAHLLHQGKPITGYALVQLTDVHEATALKFLRARQDDVAVMPLTPPRLARQAQVHASTTCRSERSTHHDELSARLQRAAEHLQHEGQPLSERAMARLAGVSRPSAHPLLASATASGTAS